MTILMSFGLITTRLSNQQYIRTMSTRRIVQIYSLEEYQMQELNKKLVEIVFVLVTEDLPGLSALGALDLRPHDATR